MTQCKYIKVANPTEQHSKVPFTCVYHYANGGDGQIGFLVSVLRFKFDDTSKRT